MRITVDLEEELLRRAKERAALDRTTLREVVETALRAHLRRRSGPRYRLRWRSEIGRLRPGVRLDNRDALFDLTAETRRHPFAG